MPVNPMQRRTKNAFLGGFLVALIIMGLIVMGLIYNMKNIKEENDKLRSYQKTMYVASCDLESGTIITEENYSELFQITTVQTDLTSDLVLSEDDFRYYDEDGVEIEKYNDDGSLKTKQLAMKVSVPAGTIVTKEMAYDTENETTSDQRIQEFNMISLPSQLEEGDYIDVRLSLPRGQDYIVLAKKQVLQCTETGIWLKLSEDEILTINNAIVESYGISGSKLYALEYSEPGIQSAASVTYPVNSKVLEIINSNPNIVTTAKNALLERYYAYNGAALNQRLNVLDPAISENENTYESNVESKNQEEITKIQTQRAEYVSSL